MRTRRTKKRIRLHGMHKKYNRMLLKAQRASNSVLVAIKRSRAKGNVFEDPSVRKRIKKLEKIESKMFLPKLHRGRV